MIESNQNIAEAVSRRLSESFLGQAFNSLALHKPINLTMLTKCFKMASSPLLNDGEYVFWYFMKHFNLGRLAYYVLLHGEIIKIFNFKQYPVYLTPQLIFIIINIFSYKIQLIDLKSSKNYNPIVFYFLNVLLVSNVLCKISPLLLN